jgi:hypothetical protein
MFHVTHRSLAPRNAPQEHWNCSKASRSAFLDTINRFFDAAHTLTDLGARFFSLFPFHYCRHP